MLNVVPLFFLLAVLVSPSQELSLGNANCGIKFQDYIQKAIEVKKDCGHAAFSDCCQPMTLFSKIKTGIYEIEDPCKSATFAPATYMYARCDMDSGNGGWLVIQRRVEGGTVDFTRNWSDYEEGFGELKGEFWYGLKNIHCLTNSASMELRMDLEDESGNKITWTYQEFRVEGPENKYRLHIGAGEGTLNTTDHMALHNNQFFSTKDMDNDPSGAHCAEEYNGGWWYEECHYTNPNGLHADSSVPARFRVSSSTTGQQVYYPNYEMKIRPKSCSLSQTSDTCA